MRPKLIRTPKTVSKLADDEYPLGTIELKIVLTERGEGRPNAYAPAPPSRYSQPRPDATATGHRAGLAADRETFMQAPYTWSGTPVAGSTSVPGGPPHSYVKFVFKYRPAAWIKEYGLQDIKRVGGPGGFEAEGSSAGAGAQEATRSNVTGETLSVSSEEYYAAVDRFLKHKVETEGPEAALKCLTTKSWEPRMPKEIKEKRKRRTKAEIERDNRIEMRKKEEYWGKIYQMEDEHWRRKEKETGQKRPQMTNMVRIFVFPEFEMKVFTYSLFLVDRRNSRENTSTVRRRRRRRQPQALPRPCPHPHTLLPHLPARPRNPPLTKSNPTRALLTRTSSLKLVVAVADTPQARATDRQR